MTTTRVALALGGGGARGYAHIGAVRELHRRNMQVVAVSGTSMGALIGGLVATGRLEDFATWASGLRRSDVLKLVDPTWSGPGVMSAERVFGEIGDLLGDVAIEDLPIPYTAVATDLAARREVWFQRGPLHAAIRASIAIPGVFTPVLINGRLLADGGLLNPVPLDPLAGAAADLTIAISLSGPRAVQDHEAPSTESTAPQRFDVWRERLGRTFASLSGSNEVNETDADAGGSAPADDGQQTTAGPEQGSDQTDNQWTQTDAEHRRWWQRRVREAEEAAPSAFQELPPGLRVSDVTALSFDAMQGMISRYRMAGLPPDLLVTVPVSAARTMDFHRAVELIELGAELTGHALDEAGYTVPADPAEKGERPGS